jgi:hypothetical protein
MEPIVRHQRREITIEPRDDRPPPLCALNPRVPARSEPRSNITQDPRIAHHNIVPATIRSVARIEPPQPWNTSDGIRRLDRETITEQPPRHRNRDGSAMSAGCLEVVLSRLEPRGKRSVDRSDDEFVKTDVVRINLCRAGLRGGADAANESRCRHRPKARSDMYSDQQSGPSAS